MLEAKQIAKELINQYGEDAATIAMLKSAEFAANLDQENWYIWEQVIIYIKEITDLKILDS
ncbi:MAG: 3-oxoacid CoA-transferase, B subunit [SAR86 cluster bacterium SAR86B]|uniref:3-oxoacid CoA-transferase, B subunit n=1 Tax=SAR86 cluster bacterium SAR86B TaxID=1123867 RepID=J4KSG6_9GAMM|nr:MAG: 3-oxoacid CoA-transferase, B subunit [SAR86 cluster bacterium SAR86B]